MTKAGIPQTERADCQAATCSFGESNVTIQPETVPTSRKKQEVRIIDTSAAEVDLSSMTTRLNGSSLNPLKGYRW